MLKHPAVILHELAHAHAHQDKVLGFEHRAILQAFQRAQNANLYQRVLFYTGESGRRDGLTNHKGYFAEGTEAFLYRNDFDLFVRAELKEYDPHLHEVLDKIRGPSR